MDLRFFSSVRRPLVVELALCLGDHHLRPVEREQARWMTESRNPSWCQTMRRLTARNRSSECG